MISHAGEELLLQCEISGDPIPRVSWKRNGVAVGVDESEVFTSFREGVARLRLRDVQSCHAGEYICEARNAKGAVQCSSRVTVKGQLYSYMSRPHFFVLSPIVLRLCFFESKSQHRGKSTSCIEQLM